MYSDFAYGHSQASTEEIALVRDMISWAKAPSELPEFSPGEAVTLNISIINLTDTGASSARLVVYNPDRSEILYERTVGMALSSGQSATVPISYQTTASSPLGIYHVDYQLLDSSGNVIQPEAETDTGRFAVSSPPVPWTQEKDIWFSVTSTSQTVAYGSELDYTFHIYNNTDQERTLEVSNRFRHTSRMKDWNIIAAPHSETTITDSVIFEDRKYMYETMDAYLKDESRHTIGTYQLSFKGYHPSVDISIATDKEYYGAGETAALNVSVESSNNKITGDVIFTIKDPLRRTVYTNTYNVDIGAGEVETRTIQYNIPLTSKLGYYIASAYYENALVKISSVTKTFVVLKSQISVAPNLPSAFNAGANTVSFDLNNTGKVSVSSGVLNVSLIAPDGTELYSGNESFSLNIAESKTLNVPITLPLLKLGDYTLRYTQSDETKTGKSTSINIPNAIAVTNITLDNSYYAVRDIVNASVTVSNTGKFNLDNVSLEVSVPDANCAETQIIPLGNSNTKTFDYSCSLPETMTAGQHAVDVTATLSSGSSVTQSAVFAIPSSNLAVGYDGLATVTAGDTVTLTVENSGGVDTNYTTEELTVVDGSGIFIYNGIAEGSVLAGEKKALADIQLPPQAADGTYIMTAEIKDVSTGVLTTFEKHIDVNGIMATLQTSTEKYLYLNTEIITGISNISNGQHDIVNESLNVAITKVNPPVVGQFLHFLPKDLPEEWRSFKHAWKVATGPDDSVYVLEYWSCLIKKFDSDGNFIKQWGGSGKGDGQFSSPDGVAVGPDGSVYVADSNNSRVQKFDKDGNFIAKWGSYGSGEGQFKGLSGISVGPDGSVYVTDVWNHRVQKFDKDGNFIAKWGSYGSGNGQFNKPHGIAVGPDGTVYVVNDTCVQKFDRDGNFIDKWVTWESWGYPNSFSSAFNIAVGPDGSVYVAEFYKYHILKLNSDGELLYEFSISQAKGIAVSSDGTVYATDYAGDSIKKINSYGIVYDKWGLNGSRDGQFDGPRSVAVNSSGSIYVADTYNNRIQKFGSEGDFIAKWDSPFGAPNDLAAAPDDSIYVVGSYAVQKFDGEGNLIETWRNYGSGDGQFKSPQNIAVGPDGSVYLTDSGNKRIQKFDDKGNFITKWGSAGSDAGQFKYHSGLAVDADGFVYVVDTGNHRIQKFDHDGNYITEWGTYGWSDGQFQYPKGIAVAPGGSVYVADTNKHRIQEFDSEGNFIAKWGSYGSDEGQFKYPQNIAVGPDGSVYVADTNNHRIQRITVSKWRDFDTIFKTTIPVTQAAETEQEYITDIGTLHATGKLFLIAELENDIGQKVAEAEYPFYIIEGNTALLFSTDKKIYRPGETVTIEGEVKNLSDITAVGLSLKLKQDDQTLYTSTFNVPADGSYPFTVTTTASTEGEYVLGGKVTQNSTVLVETVDRYETAVPQVEASLTAPDLAGNEPFDINIELKNTGKLDAAVSLQSSFGTENITIPVGETRNLQYSGHIAITTNYIFTFTGDLDQTVTKTVAYGLSASITVEPLSVYSEGLVEIPLTVTNTGQLPETLTVNYDLSPAGIADTRTYFVPAGGSITDALYYELLEGDYTISANTQKPDASLQTDFSVRKGKKAEIALSVSAPEGGLAPVTVDVTNAGYETINGSVLCKMISNQGDTVWSAEKAIEGLLPLNLQSVNFDIDPSAIGAGDFTLEASLLDNANLEITKTSAQFSINRPAFEVTQLPPNQTYAPGQNVEMPFTVRNIGDLEGTVELNLTAYDLVDATHKVVIESGAERTLMFGFVLPDDLEEKDYFADWALMSGDGEIMASGQVKYHLAGINISVDASLNKKSYNTGENAVLSISVSDLSRAALPLDLFARVNYAGYNAEQAFTLEENSTLIFDVPISEITGEKLFYGIYHESGRSIYLNSLYVREAGGPLTITTDKQVYDPLETVTYTVSSIYSGTLAVAVFDYSETGDFQDSFTGSVSVPSDITAGTYSITAQLATADGEIYSATLPIDVAGIQVKVLECENDRAKYASSDNISTSFTISSNSDIPATLKAWILDPEGNFIAAGEDAVTLSSTENLLFSGQYPLSTGITGIHRLVYGIYKDDLILVSGSESFDVGDAVLLGISTDKTDYPTNTEPVTVSFSMFGTVDVTLKILLDDEVVRTEQVSLGGFKDLEIVLDNVEPGTHTLTGELISGGLRSTKEARFVYGSELPDLSVGNNQTKVFVDSNNVAIFEIDVFNTGKTVSGETAVSFYEGESLIESKPVGILEADGNETFQLSLNVLGKAGELKMSAVVDPENIVVEFDESNNAGELTFNIPETTLFTSSGNVEYRVNEAADIISSVTNLSAVDLEGYSLRTSISSEAGAMVYNSTSVIETLPAISSRNITTYWNIPLETEEGIYSADQYILAPSGEAVATSSTSFEVIASDFSIFFNPETISIKQGEKAVYTGIFEPLGGFNELVELSIEGVPGGATVSLDPGSLIPPGTVTLEIFTNNGTQADLHELRVVAEGGGIVHDALLNIDIAAFTVNADQTEVEIKQLETAFFNISTKSINGYEGSVDLSIDGVPFGVMASWDKTSLSVPDKAKLVVLTSKYAVPGTYELTVTADDGLITHEVPISMTIEANPEIAAGLITTQGPGPKNEAWVRGFNFNLVPVLELMAFNTKYGASVTSADIDGNGYDEVIVGMGPDPKNTATFGVFNRGGYLTGKFNAFDKRYGLTLSSGDLDGDWKDEVIVGMGPGPQNPAELKVIRYNGSGFTEVASETAYKYLKYGINMAVGDIDGDNIPEIITAPGPGPENPPWIKVWSLKGDRLVEQFDFDAFGGFYGANVAVGDIDGDGIGEIIVGTGPDPKNPTVVRIYKADRTLVRELVPYDTSYRYGVNVAAVDVDNDGVDEIVTGLGSGPQNPAWVKIFRADGTEVTGFLAYPEDVKYGVRVFRARPGQ
jgi:sugar lactone lactonase YvrE